MDKQIEPLPVWKEKQNLSNDLYEAIRVQVSPWVRDNKDGLLRALAKEVIQAGYRKEPKPEVESPREITLAEAMKVVTANMQDVSLGSVAHVWHCNIAMAVYDSFPASQGARLHGRTTAHKIGNEAATRFMKILFDVSTTNECPRPVRKHAKCDGNHGGPKCADPECWNDEAE